MAGAVVSVVFGVHAVADNKDLHILEQAAADPERIPMVTIDLVKGLFQSRAATLKLDLHQRQAIDQQRDVEAGFTCTLLGIELLHLARHLKLVLAPLLFIDKAEPLLGAVIAQQLVAIAQDLSAIDNFIAFCQVQKNTVKFAVREWGRFQSVVDFNLLAQIGFHTGFVGDIHPFVVHAYQLFHQLRF